MNEYHKIKTAWERDPDTKYKTLIEGAWATPEFSYLRDRDWLWTEKVDGTNIRVMWDGERVTFGGKTDRAQIPATLLERLMERFPGDKLAWVLKQPACLYGEGYGARIQKGGGNYRPDQDFVLFDVRVDGWWLRRDSVEEIGAQLSIDVVPTVGSGTLDAMIAIARRGFTSRWGNFQAEGFVARPAVELLDRGGRRIITKIKCKDFS